MKGSASRRGPARAAAAAALAAGLLGALPFARAAAPEVACASRVPPNVLVVLSRGETMATPAGSAVPDLDGDGARTRYDLALAVLFRLLNSDGGRIDGFATPREAGAVGRFRRLISVEDELFLSGRIGLISYGGAAPPGRGRSAPFQVHAPPETPNVPPYGAWSYRAVWDHAYALGPPRSAGRSGSPPFPGDEIEGYFSVAASRPSPDPFSDCRSRIVVVISDGSELLGMREGEPLVEGTYRIYGLFVGVSAEADRARLRRLLAGRRGGPADAERVVFFDGPQEVEESSVFGLLAAPPSPGPWKGADPVVPPVRDPHSGRIHVAALGGGDRFSGPVTASLRSLRLSPAGSVDADGAAEWDAVKDGPLRALPGSTPVLVGAPSPYYTDPADPDGRRAFVQEHSRRRRVLLASTDGGTLHAFDAGSWDPRGVPAGYRAGTGEEMWAFRPRFVVTGPGEAAWGAGLREGYGDGSPAVADIRVEADAVSPGGAAKPGWRTHVIGAAGRGGRGYYALDITDPGSADYPEPVWELGKGGAPRLGSAWSTPAIGRVRRPAGEPEGAGEPGVRWVAVVGAGKGRPAGATVLLRPADLRGRGGGPRSIAVESTAGAPESGQITLSRTALERRGGRWVSRTYRATATYSAKTAAAFDNVAFRGRPDAVEYPATTTLVSWTDPGDEGKAILVLDAATGRVIRELTHPDMGEVVAAPTIAADDEGYIERVYVGDLSGNVWRATVDRAGTFDLGEGPFFSIAGQAYSRRILSKIAVAGGEAPHPRLWVHFGTGDRESPLDEPGGAVFAVYDDLPAGSRANAGAGSAARTERNLADATGFFAAIGERSARFPPLGANAAGWYAALPGSGEKVLSPPRVFLGNLFLTTFLPGEGNCAAEGEGRVYGFGAVPGKNLGEGALSENLPTLSDAASEPSRVRTLRRGGIPSAPVVSAGTRGGAVLYVGSPEGTVDAVRIPGPGSNKSIRYWMDAAGDRGGPGH